MKIDKMNKKKLKALRDFDGVIKLQIEIGKLVAEYFKVEDYSIGPFLITAPNSKGVMEVRFDFEITKGVNED